MKRIRVFDGVFELTKTNNSSWYDDRWQLRILTISRGSIDDECGNENMKLKLDWF